MSYFVRMLEKQKWEKNDLAYLGYNKTPADTITGDLRTVSNSLSLWSIENIDKLNDAILALAVMRNRLTRLDIIVIEKDKIEEKGLEVTNTPENGMTPLINFEKYHYDLVNLTYDKLGIFSQIIIDDISNGDKCMRYSKVKNSELLYDGLINDRFSLDDLDDRLREDLKIIVERKKT